MERRQEHRLREWVDRGERLAVLDHDLADGREALLLEDVLEQVEGLPADLVGLEVVGLLDELDRAVVDGLALGELLDLDRPDGLERDGLEISVGDMYWRARTRSPDRVAPEIRRRPTVDLI
jgi:hypothetical protein